MPKLNNQSQNSHDLLDLDLVLRNPSPLCVVKIDIDYFKLVTERFGDQVTLDVLRVVMELLKAALKDADQLSYEGEDKFSVVMPKTSLEGAVLVYERMRKSVERYDWSKLQSGLMLSISLGVTKLEATDTKESLLARAEKHLAASKKQGRNQVNSGDNTPASSLTFWR